jgi:hypothetical protein
VRDFAFDFHAGQFERLREHTKAAGACKASTERDAFILACRQAVIGLVSASTATTTLVVDINAVTIALADMILSSPPRAV